MKKLTTFFLITLCIFLSGCGKKIEKFSLEEKYYQSSEFNELDKDKFNDLIENKESFAIFIYQPLCSTSYEFNKILTQFSKKYQVSSYKMPFSKMKETALGDKIKYYPSLVIYNEGKLVDYLDANSSKDTNYYKNLESFEKWFSSYVNINVVNDNYTDTSYEEEIDSNLKIDAVLDNVNYSDNKVNIYFFWGNGCPHCEEEFKFLKSIETEYGDYFTLNTFEVWYNEENEKLLEQFASKMNDKVTGVPYTIIGTKTFKGFSSKYEDDFLEAIKTQYKDSYDVYFDSK